MVSTITVLGEPLFAKNENGRLKSRIGTVFPRTRTLVTLPGIHATQRRAYLDHLRDQRRRNGQPPLRPEQEHDEWNGAVDLILDDGAVLIRPDPDNMPLAFEADDLLQVFVPKHRISFLGVLNASVCDAIKRRGDWWRITPLPKSTEEMEQLIDESRVGLSGPEIYYYSKTTGIRYLTCEQFGQLGSLDDSALRIQLLEIQESSALLNAHGSPELAFFAAGSCFSKHDFAACDFRNMEQPAVRRAFEMLMDRFIASVNAELRHDDAKQAEWRNCMIAALVGQDCDTVLEDTLLGLSPEFYMQIEWLPGGCIEDGELVLDGIVEKAAESDDERLKQLYDEKPQQFIFNFVREYGNLDYVNIGRVVDSLSRRPAFYGRRGVYVAVLKHHGNDREMISIIRMQKYGVREYLDAGESLLNAMRRSDEYTEYILDRRLGCRQLGMNLPTRITARKISERYVGRDGSEFRIRSPYFERDYIRGMATDKVPFCRFENEEFALRFAALLGKAAAPNIVVGRCHLGGRPLFDDGDEVLIEDAHNMPAEIVVADHTGTFNDYQSQLRDIAVEYAGPINRRAAHLTNPGRFVAVYLDAFVDNFLRIQDDYRRRRKAFDTLFKHCPRDEKGSFAFRWERVLARLEAIDPRDIARQIRDQVVAAT
jgi:hypothetical protein